ncbi:MAG: alpha/beta fold hydrolase [Bacteroidota bacterium]
MRVLASLLLLVAAVALALGCARLAPPIVSSDGTADCVLLLHGLGRSAASMVPMADALRAEGYHVINAGYPSTEYPIDTLAARYVAPALRGGCRPAAYPERRIHVVTHSMGGILMRALAAQDGLPDSPALPDNLGRVVMLAPPNQGSEVAEALKGWWLFQRLNGPAGVALGTTNTTRDSAPLALGPVPFETGVIAGTRSLDPWFALLFDGPHDGKVAVARARVEGMADFRTVAASHPFVMRHPDVIQEVLFFLEHGRFRPETAAAS